VLGILSGKYQGDYELMQEYVNKATKRWFASHPKKGSVLNEKTISKHLTPKERREFKRAKEEFGKDWRKELATGKYRQMECSNIEFVPIKKLKKVI
jgi:hypothetical protein